MAGSELHNLLPFAEILDNIDVGIALFDPQGNYLFVNTNLINWRNIPRAEFLRRNVHDFLKIRVTAFLSGHGEKAACHQTSNVSRLSQYGQQHTNANRNGNPDL